MRESKPGLAMAACLISLAAACSPGPPPAQSEEDLHAIGPDATEAGHPHVFLCAGNERLLVDFGAEGLRLQIRRPEGAPPLTLSAPAQGLPFRGSGVEATMQGQRLQIVSADGSRRTCRRETKG
jgi:hypothetical protein